jgi:hypothetical protein
MKTTVLGMFDQKNAGAVVVALRGSGIPISSVNVFDREHGAGAETYALEFSESLRNGSALVAVEATEIDGPRVRELMEEHHATGVHLYQRPMASELLGESSVDEDAFALGTALGASLDRAWGWTTVEPEAKQRWENKHPGTWDRFREIIHNAWDTVLGERRR